MTTAGEILDRTETEFLYPGDDPRAWDTLASTITAASASATISGLQDYVAPFSIIEIDSELIRTGNNSGTILPLQDRGLRETTAASHTAGTKVFFEPEYPRQAMLNALASAVGMLYPMGLYYRDTVTDIATGSSATAFDDATIKEVISVLYRDGSTRWMRAKRGHDYEVFTETSPIEIQFNFAPTTSSSTRIIVKKDFVLPDAESDDLTSTCLVPATLVPYLPLAVAGYLLGAKEPTSVQRETVARLLEMERIPVGSNLSVGGALMSLFRNYVAMERRRQAEQDPYQIRIRR